MHTRRCSAAPASQPVRVERLPDMAASSPGIIRIDGIPWWVIDEGHSFLFERWAAFGGGAHRVYVVGRAGGLVGTVCDCRRGRHCPLVAVATVVGGGW